MVWEIDDMESQSPVLSKGDEMSASRGAVGIFQVTYTTTHSRDHQDHSTLINLPPSYTSPQEGTCVWIIQSREGGLLV